MSGARVWRLAGPSQEVVLVSREGGLPEAVHWGAPLGDVPDGTLAEGGRIDITGGMLDATAPLSVCPEASRSFPGQPGLILRAADGAPLLPRLALERVEEREGGLTVHAADAALGLRYAAHFDMDAETGILALWAELRCDAPVLLHWLAAPVLPGPALCDEMTDYAGRWCGEFQPVRTPFSPGLRWRENRTGRTGHEHFPGLVLPARGATRNTGAAWAMHYGWSGGHRMLAEELPDGRRQIQWGHAGRTEEAATRFRTATLHAAHSDAGTNGCAVAFQRHLRDRIVRWPDASRPRPVHYNCWEAIYFDHSLAKLTALAERAAALGAERFVLDDGWFGRRDDDTTSLGDWTVDRRKWPDGLQPLIDRVHDLGMSFGLWFEPEMVSPDSDLLRAHPGWALGAEDQVLGRFQKALDLSLPAVRDHLFDAISTMLADHAIDYVKWDHNRVLPQPDAAQTRGVYDLLDRLRAAHPAVEIETCASGGGRIDFGILSRTHRVWLSDSNDALERLRMQHEAAQFLPAAVTGSHVGPRRAHTTHRTLDIRLRAWVAAQRHMGFEMDPAELTPEEEDVLKRVTEWWKANRDWTMHADILPLDAPDPAVIAEVQVSPGRDRFILFAGKAASSPQIAPKPLPLAGLDPDAIYEVAVAEPAPWAPPALSRGPVALRDGPIRATGRWLMGAGVTLPWSFPETIWVLEGRRL